MKRPYTIYNSICKKAAKLEGITLEALELVIRNKSESKDPDTRRKALDFGRVYEVEEKIRDGNAVHLFMPDREFCDWLVNCVKESDPRHAWFLQQMLGTKNVGVFHFPCSSKLPSVAFYVVPFDCNVEVDGLGMKTVPKGRWLFVTCGSGNADFECFSCEIGTEQSLLKNAMSHYLVRLIVGLGMYSSCFPEVIRKGPPIDLKHPANHKHQNAVWVQVASEVCSAEGTHESPTAHYRRGHFRVLNSERFTHKRFQAIFVRDTFVKGKCLTVLSPEEADAVA